MLFQVTLPSHEGLAFLQIILTVLSPCLTSSYVAAGGISATAVRWPEAVPSSPCHHLIEMFQRPVIQTLNSDASIRFGSIPQTRDSPADCLTQLLRNCKQPYNSNRWFILSTLLVFSWDLPLVNGSSREIIQSRQTFKRTVTFPSYSRSFGLSYSLIMLPLISGLFGVRFVSSLTGSSMLEVFAISTVVPVSFSACLC